MNTVTRRIALAALTAPLVSLPFGVGTAAAGGHASGDCSPAFTLVDLSSYLQYPPVAAGIAAGTSTVADDTVFFNSIDKNGNRLTCVQPSGSQAAAHLYYVNAVDDHSAA